MSAMRSPRPLKPRASAPVPGLPAGGLSPILGREREIRTVIEMLDRDTIRIVSLLGPGGVGKTRLAQEVAGLISGDFAHGAVFVPLASVRNPGDVPDAVARRLGLEDAPGCTAEELLARFLADRHLLLVLDNLEQVIASAGWVSALAAGAPRTKVLLTSRTPLRIQGEQQFVVPPLAVPDEVDTSSASVMLFVQRARAVNHDFQIDTEVASVIGEICRQLDGLPLAIELAAARMKILSPDALLARLTDRLAVLTGGQRDVPPRLRSMRDAISWSYELLSPEEEHLFRRLSVFLGGFTLEAADAVAAWPGTIGPTPPTIDVLQSLVDQSLVQRVPGSARRFSMLETIREYGQLELTGSEDADTALDAHAAYFLHLGKRAEEALTGPLQADWLTLLEEEHANIRRTVTWLESHGRVHDAIELVQHISFFLLLRGHIRETLDSGQRWLLLPELAERTRSRGLALLTTGEFLKNFPDVAGSRQVLTDAAEILFEVGDRAHAAKAFGILASVWNILGDFERMGEAAERAIELATPLNLHRVISSSLFVLADGAEAQGDAARGHALYQQSYGISKHGGDLWLQAYGLVQLAVEVAGEGDLEAAERIAMKYLDLFERLGSLRELPVGWGTLAWISRLRGDAESATRHLDRALAIAEQNEYLLWLHTLQVFKACLEAEGGDIPSAVEMLRRAIRSERHWEPECHDALCLGTCAQIAIRADDPEAAARFLGALSSTAVASAPRMQLDWYDVIATSLRERGSLRASLGDAAFERAYAAGARLSPADALEEAFRYTPPSLIPRSEPSGRMGDLSIRELQVLEHVANGLSNQEIADALYVSLRTVTTHVTHILTKLDVPSRTAAASFAIRNGIA